MNWTNYFEAIYLVNLPERTDRLELATSELNKYNIPFTVIEAHENQNGNMGLNLTMLDLFSENADKERILVFEDDILFLTDPNPVMQKVVEQLKQLPDWALFYLGINMDKENNLFEKFTGQNILSLNFGFSSHALAYTSIAMQRLMFDIRILDKPFDVHLNQSNLPQYCVYPLLATQRNGYSSIEKKESTYEYIPQRYNHSVAHLLKNQPAASEIPIDLMQEERYLVLAPDTSAKFSKDEIIMQFYPYTWETKLGDLIANPEKYPHLFRKLHWYECRDSKDLPKYLKFITDEEVLEFVLKVKEYIYHKDANISWAFTYLWQNEPDEKRMSLQGWLPATENEYIDFEKLNNDKTFLR